MSRRSVSATSPSDSRYVDTVIAPRQSDLGGGFQVSRLLPSRKRRMVGPFVFLDQMGPTIIQPGQGLDVLPHPHIGLATVTYLFDGELVHRDSLGTVQTIKPGELNWMSAGRGIAHSERTPASLRRVEHRLFGIQAWVALPRAYEESEPAFAHYAVGALPVYEQSGMRLRLIAGSWQGLRSPARTCSDSVYADIALAVDARYDVPPEHEEQAIYLVEGKLVLPDGKVYESGHLLVLKPQISVTLQALEGDARLLLLGGQAFPEQRHIWWNFVSSSKSRIEQAKGDWKAGRFPRVAEETERLALPGDKQATTVNYP
ncbi:hypothetical protein CAI21_19255 [Alkalilimnicola ehrlichii]|uniref:Pirin family protein n=1 Tax=Alkalilimnicola ehrlichii TaxID=351052 RepID=A0A3E0WHU7_9GAMM|nr:pirin family protein [Alkalilimnicola ehrlichii]RFA25374.1 hypothetical protein CAI21_19255 [Alkalilimnicola ehrlichii]RFA32550.1 hypothetical protein CAL65_19520 [Alkalilimnicola ehrlichii]